MTPVLETDLESAAYRNALRDIVVQHQDSLHFTETYTEVRLAVTRLVDFIAQHDKRPPLYAAFKAQRDIIVDAATPFVLDKWRKTFRKHLKAELERDWETWYRRLRRKTKDALDNT